MRPDAAAVPVSAANSDADTRPAQLLAAARRLLETEGIEAITMRRLGAEVGIRGPSLYKHFASKAEIETALIIQALTEQADAVEQAEARVDAVMTAYRHWALQHPQAHRLINERPLERAALPEGLETRAAAPLTEACGGDTELCQAVWATLKGVVDLELADRFPPGTRIEHVYQAAAHAYDLAIAARPERQRQNSVHIAS